MPKSGSGVFTFIGGAIIIIMIGKCSSSNYSSTKNNSSAHTTSIQESFPTVENYKPQSDQIIFVNATSLNGRTEPNQKSLSVIKLNRGDILLVSERRGDWIKVIKGMKKFWVLAKYISNSQSEIQPVLIKPNLILGQSSKKESKRSQRSYNSSCSCSSNSVCTGPRGGRYCITSGGSKRYGV